MLIIFPMRRRNTITNDLRDELSKALRAERLTDALALYELIEKRKPDEPRWPHRRADLLNRMGRKPAAVAAYEQLLSLLLLLLMVHQLSLLFLKLNSLIRK